MLASCLQFTIVQTHHTDTGAMHTKVQEPYRRIKLIEDACCVRPGLENLRARQDPTCERAKLRASAECPVNLDLSLLTPTNSKFKVRQEVPDPVALWVFGRNLGCRFDGVEWVVEDAAPAFLQREFTSKHRFGMLGTIQTIRPCRWRITANATMDPHACTHTHTHTTDRKLDLLMPASEMNLHPRQFFNKSFLQNSIHALRRRMHSQPWGSVARTLIDIGR